MMWLAGLLGIAGLGAASMVALTDDDDTDTDADSADDDAVPQIAFDGNFFDGDLFDAFEEPEADTDAGMDDGYLSAAALDAADWPAPAAGSGGPVLDDDVYADLIEERAGVDDTSLPGDEPSLLGPAPGPLTDWLGKATESEPLDYAPDRDSLVLVWDDSAAGSAAPQLAVAPDPDDPEVMQLRLGNSIVADVYGDSDLRLSDIIVLPLSAAELVGLTPA